MNTSTDKNPGGRPSLTGPGKHTPQRQVRIPDDEWYASVAKAKAEGRNISAVIRELLREWRDGA